MDVDADDDDSDDLFDEDELVTISKQTKALKKSGGKQLRGAKNKTATRKRSRLEDYDSSDDEDRLEDEEEDRRRRRSLGRPVRNWQTLLSWLSWMTS